MKSITSDERFWFDRNGFGAVIGWGAPPGRSMTVWAGSSASLRITRLTAIALHDGFKQRKGLYFCMDNAVLILTIAEHFIQFKAMFCCDRRNLVVQRAQFLLGSFSLFTYTALHWVHSKNNAGRTARFLQFEHEAAPKMLVGMVIALH
jgi:hypothetical protein